MANTFIQPTSETDLSKGESTESDPTSVEEAQRLDKLRNISFSVEGVVVLQKLPPLLLLPLLPKVLVKIVLEVGL